VAPVIDAGRKGVPMKRYLGIALALLVVSSVASTTWKMIKPPARKKRPRRRSKPKMPNASYPTLVPRPSPGSTLDRDYPRPPSSILVPRRAPIGGLASPWICGHDPAEPMMAATLLHAKRLRDGTEAGHEVAHERREEHRHADSGGEPDGGADDGLASHAGSLTP